jgi:hypothetical protein
MLMHSCPVLSHQAELQGHAIYIPSKSKDNSSGQYMSYVQGEGSSKPD